MNLQEARKRIPELDGLSDDAALSVIQQVYYPDIDRSTLASRLGVKVAAPPAPERTWGQAIGDTAVQLAEGVNTTLGAIPSIVAPDGSMAGFFRDNAEYWRDKQSDVLKGRIAATDQRIQEAGKEGVMSQIGTAVSEYWNDPAQAARLVATNLPSMAATLGTGALAGAAAKGVAAARGVGAAGEAALAAQYGTRTAMATNAALNAGGARGEAYEDLKRAALAQGMSSEQAEQAALDGSIMPGVVGGVAGAVSGKLGLEKALLGQPGAGAGTALRRAAGSFGAELAGEQIEEVAPKLTTNYEAGKIDPARSLTDDLGRTMVETAIGAGPGALVAGGVEGMNTPAQAAADAIRATEDVSGLTPTLAPTLALPAPERGVIQVGSDGTARTPAYQAPGYVGDVTDVEPRAVNPVREQVAAAAEQGGTLSRAALKAIDTGLSDAMQPAPEQAPPQISLEEADARDQAAYEQFFANLDAEPVVGRYVENDDDIPDFDAASNATDEEFLRSLDPTITDQDIQDAIATARQPAIPQSSPAVIAGPQANEPTGPRQGTGGNQAAQGQVTPRQPDNFTGTPSATLSQQGVTARPGPEFGAQYALAQVRPNQKREAAAQGMATPAPTDILNPSGEPFKTKMAADLAAKKTPGAAVLPVVDGGFLVRPQEPVNVQDVPQAPEVPQAAPAISQPGQAPQAVGAQPAGPAAGVPAEGAGAVEAAGVKTGGFDSAAFDNARANTIKASKAAGNKHLDELPAYVESMRGQQVYYAHDNKVRGVIRTVDNRGNVYIDWADSYSAEKEMASPVKDGKKTVMRSSIGPTDLKDYVVGEPNKPQTEAQQAQAATENVASNSAGQDEKAIRYELPPEKYAQQQGNESWMAAQSPSFKPTSRQQLLMDAVAKALDDGAYYNNDVDDHVAKALGVTLEQRARNSRGVEGGDFGFDVYNARRAVEAQRSNAKSREFANALNLNPGDALGTLIFNDGKVTTGVKVVGLNESGLIATITGKRGAATLNGEVGVDAIASAMGRAKERGKRKDGYDEFIVGRSAKLQEGIAAAQEKSQQNQPPASTQQAQAATESVAPDAEQSPAQETTHNGTRIYPTKIKVGDEVKSMWAVESPDNQRRRAAGERTIGGDSLHDSIEQAKAAAEREAKRDAEQQAAKAEQDAADKARLDAEEARKAANRPKTVVERRKDAILDGPSKIGQGTKRAVITTAVDNGYAIEAKMVYDHAAKKRDQEAVDRASRAGYILGVSNENLPLVKAGNEAKARLKEGKYEKPEYRVYQGSDTKAPFREITKTEYDYAQELKAQRAAAPQAEAAPAAATQQATDDFLPEGWIKIINGYTKRPVYRMEQGGGQPFAVVTQVEGMQYEVQIRHGSKQLTVSNQTGALSEVLAKAEAELTRMTQADSVTHQDPGEKAEAATPAVVTDSLKKAARNEDTKPSEMRKWLVAEIDKELLQAADRPDYDEAVKRMGEKDAISMFTGNGPLGKNNETGYITFDVPGDGKYKVRNSVRGLLEFRKNVMASQGFKDSGQKRVKPEQNDGVQGGSGGNMAAITNMVEEGDFEAARDYAEAVGVSLDDVKVPKGERKTEWEMFRKTGVLPRLPDTRPQPAPKTAAQVDAEKQQAAEAEAEAKKPNDTGWTSGGQVAGGRMSRIRTIKTEDGRTIVARLFEWAGRYEDGEVNEGSKLLLRLNDSNRAQERIDAFLDRLVGKTPALDLMGFKMEPIDDDGSFRLLDGNMVVSVERTDTGLQARHRSAKSSPRLTDQQAVEWAANIRDESRKSNDGDKPAIPAGYKPAGEPFYRGGKQIQGYAPFAPGERVTMKDSAGQSGVIESLASPDDSGVFASAVVKFDNGMEQMVQFGKLEAAAAQPDTPKLTPAEAKSLMAWEDLGQKDGVKTHALTFYESQADKDAKRGRMIVAKVSKGDRSATAWMVDGEEKTFGALAQAKKLAEEVGMKKLAQGIRAMTYNEAERFVMSAIDRSGEPVQAGRTDNLSAKQAAQVIPSRSFDSRANTMGVPRLRGFDRFGSGKADVKLAQRQAESLVGHALGFETVVSDELPADTPAAFDRDSGRVLVNPLHLQFLTQGQLTSILVEEYMHGVDSVGSTRVMSVTSERFATGGDIRSEIEANRSSNAAFDNFLKYPLDFSLSQKDKSVELFARLSVLYFNDPTLFKSSFPTTYEAYHAIFGLERDAARGSDSYLRGPSWRERIPGGQGSNADGIYGPAGDRLAQRLDGKPADQRLGQLRHQLAEVFGATKTGGFYGRSLSQNREIPEGAQTANPDIRYRSATAASIASSMGDMTPDQEKAYKNVAGVKAVPTVRERMDALKANLGLKLRQGLVDQFAAIKQLDQNAYVQARMSKGTDGTLEAMLMYGKPFMRDGAPDVDVKDGGFAKVLASLKGEQDRWMMWIAAQRAEKLKAEGKENLMTDDDISALKTLNAGKMADGTARMPIYAKALAELNEYNDAMLKLAMDSGLIDQAAYDLMAGQPYVPFYRLMEDGDMKGPKFSSGLTNQKAWQKLKGGTQQLNADLLQNMLLNWSHLLQASAKNRAAIATMDAAEKMAVAYKVSADTKGAVKVMRDGSAEHWMVEDPYLLDAISAIHYVPSPLMKPLAKFKQLLTWGVTVNPTFKIRNLIRDSVSAIAQADLGYNPAGNVAKGWKLTAKDSQIYASMLASGGLIKFGTQENTDRLRAQVAKLGGVMLDKSGADRFFGQIKDLYDVYNEFGDRAENVNRAALYDALIKKGKTHAEAAFMARDLMDFSMGGSAPVVRFLTQTVPFLNARLVGLDKLGRAAMEDPRRFAAVSGAVALASLALLAAYSDDDDWKKREDWDRDAYWWFKVGEQAYRIPKPFEVGAIGTLAERTAELMLSDEMTGKRYMERVSHMLSGTFSFNPVPQAFKPLLDLYANKDSFTGRAIESQADQRLRPQDRYSERTPEVAKFLGGLGLPDPAQLVKGEYSALSPKQVEHLIRGYFSWVGTAAMTVSDFGLRPLAGRGERPDMRLKDVFIAGNFVENLPTGSSRYVTQMYEQSRQVEQAYASYQEAIKAGDTDKAQSIKESAGPLLRNRPAYTAATRQLAEINRMAKRIEADQAMAGAAKRARLTQLEQQRHVIAQRVSRLAAATP